MGSVLRKPEIAPVVLVGVEIDAKREHSVSIGRRKIVTMWPKKVFSFCLVTADEKGVQAETLEPIGLFDFRRESSQHPNAEFAGQCLVLDVVIQASLPFKIHPFQIFAVEDRLHLTLLMSHGVPPMDQCATQVGLDDVGNQQDWCRVSQNLPLGALRMGLKKVDCPGNACLSGTVHLDPRHYSLIGIEQKANRCTARISE